MTRIWLVAATVIATLALAGSASAASGTFSNAGSFTIPSGAPGTTSGSATPYPSSITVTGLPGSITDVNVKLNNIGHTHPDDLDIVVVSPSGDSVILMSDACGSTDFEDFDWTFDDAAAGPMPDSPAGACTSFFYRPSSYDGASDTWPAAFPGPHGTALSRFNGENANGSWYLYVRDDAGGDVGDIEGGWSLTINTGPSTVTIPGTGTSGSADPYPHNVTNSAPAGRVATDVNVVFNGITHSHPDDLDILLVGPQGQASVLMSDACGSHDITNYFWRWDDEAAAVMTDAGSTNVCSAFNHRPTNHGVGDSFPSAPAGPHNASLAAFDLLDPRGTWSAYIRDDVGGDSGFLINPMVLEITTREAAGVSFSATALELEEGTSGEVKLLRSGPAAFGPGTVDLAVSGGEASPGSDFTDPGTTVTFLPGETEKTIPLDALADGGEEARESYSLTISNGMNDALPAAPSTVEVTIPGTQPPPQPPSGGGNTADRTDPIFRLLSKALVLRPNNTVRVRLRGPANETAPTTAKIVLSAALPSAGAARRVVLARKSVTLQPSRRTTAVLRLKKKRARAIRARGGLRTRLTTTVTDPAGNRTKVAKRLRLSAPR